MDVAEMKRRRESALESLQDAIDELGPITDSTRGTIREPVLEVIDEIYGAGDELKAIRFDVPE